jgi:hypothetical protein
MSYASNINAETGIAFGYISARALDSDVVEALFQNGTDPIAEEAYKVWRATKADMLFDTDETYENIEQATEAADELCYEFWEDYETDEPQTTGEFEGVTFASSYLGGALNFFIIKSPVITEHARLASPCVPNAGILDTLDGDVQSYDVPANWRYSED